MRHSLAIEVGPFMDRWENMLRTHTPGSASPILLDALDRDAEAFGRFGGILGDITSDVRRGIAMRWCMDVRSVSRDVISVRDNPEQPAPGEGQVSEAMKVVRQRMRAIAMRQINELLEAGAALRPWVNVYDGGVDVGLLPLPDAPPAIPHSVPGKRPK